MSMLRRIRQYAAGLLTDAVRRETNPRKRAIEHISEFVKYNHMQGDYLEFGVCGGHTFRYMYDRLHATGREDVHMYAFDSFEGLPEPKDMDVHPDFEAGKFCQSQADFEARLSHHGIDTSRYTIVAGFYDKVLTPALHTGLPIKQAAVIWIDCDLYESTREALRFVTPYLKTGTIIAFDDWFCFDGDPGRGEQRAFREFSERHPEFRFAEFLRFSWAGKAFVTKVQL